MTRQLLVLFFFLPLASFAACSVLDDDFVSSCRNPENVRCFKSTHVIYRIKKKNKHFGSKHINNSGMCYSTCKEKICQSWWYYIFVELNKKIFLFYFGGLQADVPFVTTNGSFCSAPFFFFPWARESSLRSSQYACDCVWSWRTQNDTTRVFLIFYFLFFPVRNVFGTLDALQTWHVYLCAD